MATYRLVKVLQVHESCKGYVVAGSNWVVCGLIQNYGLSFVGPKGKEGLGITISFGGTGGLFGLGPGRGFWLW